MINRHPEAELLVEYASGSIGVGATIAVSTHLQYCDTCDHAVRSLNQIGGEYFDQIEAQPVDEGLLDKVLEEIDLIEAAPAPKIQEQSPTMDEVGSNLPTYVQQLLPPERLHWKFLSPALRVATIAVGEQDSEVALHRIKAGGSAPEHDHEGDEITVVLSGSFSDEDGIYQPGDFILRNKGDVHRPFSAQNEECICLSVLSAPIKLTGLKSVLNPFLGFSPR